MVLITRVTVKCDNCESQIVTNAFDSLGATRIARKRGWIVHDWDSYGNQGHFCCEECRAARVKLCEGVEP